MLFDVSEKYAVETENFVTNGDIFNQHLTQAKEIKLVKEAVIGNFAE